MIGYYVHHVGQGHARRAEAIAAQLSQPVTGLSSLPRPRSWSHDWVVLPRDDDGDEHPNATAGGRLHWAPLGHAGLQARMVAVANWIAASRPSVIVSDLSVEITALGRLLGVPIVTVAIPGVRDDPAHQLGYDLAEAILAPWPRLDEDMCVGLERHAAKVHYVGGISRFDGRCAAARPRGSRAYRQVLALLGAGGSSRVRRPDARPGWRWIERGPGRWIDDPWPDICTADVVVTHCGIGALSDVAAARKPVVLLPEPRPHDEQVRTARSLARAGLGIVMEKDPAPDEWAPLLSRALSLDTTRWAAWSSGDGAARSADVIVRTARRPG
jgi:hypothetical protein